MWRELSLSHGVTERAGLGTQGHNVDCAAIPSTAACTVLTTRPGILRV